ncbi:DMT family transporter [Bacteroidales bacterium]|nr:DMT family transporter [Bacteroidales bacterium]
MSKQRHIQNLIFLNVSILLMSTSGVLGRYIALPVPVIIVSRAVIASILLVLFCKWKGIDLTIKKKDRGAVILSGALLGIHWITYFQALKLSNVAIGMLSLFTFPVITSFLEPLLLKTKFHKIHILLGILVLTGIYYLVPEFSFESEYVKAVGYGMFSAICYSLRNIITKKKVGGYNGSMMMFHQLLVVSVMLMPCYFFFDISNIPDEFGNLMLLAVITTTLGHTMWMYSLQKFSATTASMICAIQPVFGVLIGIVTVHEIPHLTTVFGGSLILISVVIESVRSSK